MEWKWLVRGRCIVRAKASRAKCKVSFHRRKWLQRAAMKQAARVHTANHKPERITDQGRAKTAPARRIKDPADSGR
eukprot:13707248-Heterocapsa_arctica.AAC.1